VSLAHLSAVSHGIVWRRRFEWSPLLNSFMELSFVSRGRGRKISHGNTKFCRLFYYFIFVKKHGVPNIFVLAPTLI
jgi:hypothetical protein